MMNKGFNFLSLVLLILILYSVKSYAWGFVGHKIVAEIAKKNLDKNIIDSVQKYLGTMSFEDASVWMDVVRSDHSYDYMKTWHYVNVEKDKTYVKTKDPEVINEIEIAISTLKEKTHDKDKINFALKVLFHLVGDIHQPLHCGYADDKGGNTVKLQYLNNETNLHKVWDSEIIESTGINLESCLKIFNEMSPRDKKNAKIENVEVWMNESRALLPEVYKFNTNIKQEYIDRNKPVIEKQLIKAGMRLAYILDKNFK